MRLNRLESAINRENRAKLNENMSIIENDFSNMNIDVKGYKEAVGENSRLVNEANLNASKAVILAKSVQEELDSIVVEGDSSVEAAQARTNSNTGETYSSLRARLDEENEILTQQLEQFKQEKVFLSEFGVVGDGVTDDTNALNQAISFALNNNCVLIVPEPSVSYRVSKFHHRDNVVIIGLGKPRFDLYYNAGVSTIPLLGFGSHSITRNIHFNCLETNIEWNRGELKNRIDVTIDNCKIEGFRHNSSTPNAWGLYMQNSKDIRLTQCEITNNTQADIAIVEGCENITIDGVITGHINFEPNFDAPTRMAKVSNSKIERLSLLENSFIGVSVDSLLVENCEIQSLRYDGCHAQFVNCKIADYQMEYFVLNSPIGMGKLKIDNVSLSKNLLLDETIERVYPIGTDFSVSNPHWVGEFAPNANILGRENHHKYGRCFVLNPQKQRTRSVVTSEVNVDFGKKYLLSLTAAVDALWANSNDGVNFSFLSNYLVVKEYSATDTLIRTILFSTHKTPENTSVEMVTNTGLYTPSSNDVVKIHISLKNTRDGSISKAKLYIKSISLQEINGEGDDINTYTPYVKTFYNGLQTSIPAFGSQSTHLVGDVIDNNNKSVGQYEKFVCIAAGNPATFRGVNQIGVLRGTTAQRPTSVYAGYKYLDNTLNANGKEIIYNGSIWVDSTGAQV